MTDNAQLLRQYVEQRSEAAFGQLVEQHINLVYSTALRLVNGDTHFAQDIAQTVFTDLARKAASLPRLFAVGGWLYQHTCFVAATAIRTAQRRQAREREAAEMNALDDHTEPGWQQLAPLLDEAMQHLQADDRDALVLRFFERRDLRAVGSVLGISEDAAQKRVTRALEKLRILLLHRGATLTATTLATMLATEAVVMAPAGLAGTVVSTSLAGAAATGEAGLTLLKLFSMTKLKVAAVGAAVLAGLVTPLVLQHQSLKQLGAENQALRAQAAELAAVREANARLGQQEADAAELERLRQEHLELLRLRGLVALQRRENAALAPAPESRSTQPAVNPAPVGPILNVIRYASQPPGGNSSRVTVSGTSSIGDWSLEGRLIAGSFEAGKSFPRDVSVLSGGRPSTNLGIAKAEVSILVRSLKSKFAKMDEVMQESMREKQFKQIHFKLNQMTAKRERPARGASWTFDTVGELAIAGVTNLVDLEVGLERLGNGQLKFTGSKHLSMAEFGVKPPALSLGVGLVQTDDEIGIQFEWVVAPAR